jgi:hypothetical protein
MSKPPRQIELFKAETTWFHVFKSMIDSGDLAKLSGSAVKVYLVVKSYTNFSTGQSFPAIETVAEKTGLSERQVLRCLDELEVAQYINKSKTGRNNLYTLREKIEIKTSGGIPKAVATWDYLPDSVREAVADLRHVMVTGDFNGAKIVNIQNLHVQINQVSGENNTQIQVSDETLQKISEKNPELLERLLSIRNAVNKTMDIDPESDSEL